MLRILLLLIKSLSIFVDYALSFIALAII